MSVNELVVVRLLEVGVFAAAVVEVVDDEGRVARNHIHSASNAIFLFLHAEAVLHPLQKVFGLGALEGSAVRRL